MKTLDEHDDNDQIAYSIAIGESFRGSRLGDVTRPNTKVVHVSYRQVREMFIKFVQEHPEVQGKPRDQQVREWNLVRAEDKQQKIDAVIVAELLIPDSSASSS